MVNIFNELLLHYKDENFKLITFLESLPPPSPSDTKIVMNNFDLNHFRNTIMINISKQRLDLWPNTISFLIEFFNSEFVETTKKVYLQVFLHLTKMNTKLLLKNTQDSGTREQEKYFNTALNDYLEVASRMYGAAETVCEVSDKLKSEIVNSLLSKPILTAFDSALKKVIDPKCSYIPKADIEQKISNMKIYCVKKFAPLKTLRGVSLVDGVMFCSGNLAGSKELISYKADLITLMMHECSHYLARLYCDNFNFSSPYSTDLVDVVRADPTDSMLPLELGRCVELLIFDEIQPDWNKSSFQAARTFIERLHSTETIPVIRKDEHEALRLRCRKLPSPPFGIDLLEEDVVLC